jgi:Spy/CpxP family protein refolding chaperone
MKKVYGLCFVLALVVLATAVYAAPADRGPASGPGWGMQGDCMQQGAWGSARGGSMHHGAFWSRLNLSKEQTDKMRDVWSRYEADTRNLRYDLMARRVEMQRLFTDPKADQASLLAKEKEMAGLRQKLTERRIQATLEWRSLLTPEQMQKLDRMPRGRGMGRGFGMM